MENKQPLLSICIPTYKRAKFLQISLDKFRQAIKTDMDIELIVSDNCSPDETPNVVQSEIEKGLRCTYIRNEKNIGPDANFLQCFHSANGKYIWLCGDDDYLIPDRLDALYDSLAAGDYGLVELNQDATKFNLSPMVFTDPGAFLSEVHVWITFMSCNIIRKEIVDSIDGDKYADTNLIQVPFFLNSATMGLPNLMYYPQVLDCGADSGNNGGYNLFEVFCENLLTMIHEIADDGKLVEKQFRSIKKSIFCRWMIGFYTRFFIEHDYGSFKMENAKAILNKWYGMEIYYYVLIVKQWIKHAFKIVLGRHIAGKANAR